MIHQNKDQLKEKKIKILATTNQEERKKKHF